ncbi:hypothetical protein [Prolixibacter denitrificans]|uniref:Outer membrane protein with beta-barrel domain n=1 Tax=Prolixibacter denitrificans TaxID=1541063 RepID=A0A2P8C8D1_9BACT|nr:hypothetical protein [Prolixibacter denitrificans]PSK81221.1 hypothetical protein CLV93_1105 [Prolixibacter denitrificans]GET21694.1 hypothetical protein JCM18694_19400 [Prolixibacter denitrificans]
MKLRRVVAVSAVIYVLTISKAFSQLSVSVGYGLQCPGRQDLKFRYYENGVLVKNLKTSKAISSWSPVNNLDLTYWHKKSGFAFSYVYWKNDSKGITFLTTEIPPFKHMEQSRNLYLLDYLHKTGIPFLQKTSENTEALYGYWGVGVGVGVTETTPGLEKSIKPAMQLLYGVNYKIYKRLSLFAEARYLLAHDADNAPPATFTGWKVDSSGHPFPLRPHPHLDTRFYDLQVGLRFRL